jgi:hypothetical protein
MILIIISLHGKVDGFCEIIFIRPQRLKSPKKFVCIFGSWLVGWIMSGRPSITVLLLCLVSASHALRMGVTPFGSRRSFIQKSTAAVGGLSAFSAPALSAKELCPPEPTPECGPPPSSTDISAAAPKATPPPAGTPPSTGAATVPQMDLKSALSGAANTKGASVTPLTHGL